MPRSAWPRTERHGSSAGGGKRGRGARRGAPNGKGGRSRPGPSAPPPILDRRSPPPGGRRLAGGGRLRRAAAGPLQRPRLTATLEATDLRGGDWRIAQTSASLALDPEGDLADPATRFHIAGEGRVSGATRLGAAL